MSKRSIAYIKPSEPTFLRRLKEQAGYKEGPTIDTKRERGEASDDVDDDDFAEDTNEELPTVVVLKSGDLTAEQADTIQKNLDKEEEEKPADLKQPIVFKSRKERVEKPPTAATKRESSDEKKKEKSAKKAKKSSLLSFNDEEEEEEDN